MRDTHWEKSSVMRDGTRPRRDVRRVALVITSLLMVCGLSACSCSAHLGQASSERGYDPDYAVAVIQTNRQVPSTFIDYYDEDLDLVASLEYPYLTAQSPWGEPVAYDGYVYMTPQGTGLDPSSSVVAVLELGTGEVRDRGADGGVTNVAVNDRYIFAAASGGMGRIDRETGEVLSIELPGYLFPFAYGDRVYVLNAMRPDDYAHAWLYVMDERLDVLETIDFGPDSYVTQPTGFIGERLYFASIFGDDEIPWEDKEWNLSYYSVADGEVYTLTTVTGMRLESVESTGGRLYAIATGDLASDSINKILVIDEATGDIEGEHGLSSFVPQYILARDGILYVGGTDAEDRSHGLRSYIPDGPVLRETGRVPLMSRDSSSLRYYIGGLFAQNEGK